jgi:hypothetical protein
MEAGKRRVPEHVARKVVQLFRLSPTVLPLPPAASVEAKATDAMVEQGLARLGYPGLAHRRKRGKRWNPSALLLAALSVDRLDSRLAESLPWLLLSFQDWDVATLVARAKARDLQNRLGFTVALAREVADRTPSLRHRVAELRLLEETLNPSRLAREDTFGRRETSDRMRAWVRENRSEAARHWNLLTDLKPEHLPYVDKDSGAVAQLPW